MNKLFFYAYSALLVGGTALSVVSCADSDFDNGGTNDNKNLVRFNVNDVQEGAISRGVMTRGAITPGLGSNDLAGGKLVAHNNRNIDVCLIETTVEGVNPVKADARTRANIIATSTLGDFSTSGIRGTATSGILTTPEWFHAKQTKSNGELYSPIYWSFAQPKARFFAVYPNVENYAKMTINSTDATSGSPSVDFEVNDDVTKQVDLMTACTGDVEYVTHFQQPTTNLDFRHALTGIRFAVGQNLSWNKTIDKVELRNTVMKSKYVLSKQFNGNGAEWDHSNDTRGNATLSGVSVSTSANPNVIITGNAGDNYTFYMIPQQLTGYVTAYVHCTDGTEITVPLKGEWKAGTTRTYKLSQTNSTWDYTFHVTPPSRAANYDETQSQAYGVTSYREDPVTHQQQAVAWELVGYDANDDNVFSMDEKPAWLTSLSKTEGDGSTAADPCTATLTKNVVDMLAKRNEALKAATALGTGTPYDLSTKGGSVARSTANSYLISAPGHYRIPLVYGNAIENGITNEHAYISQAPAGNPNVLYHFKDHDGQDITDPWIEKTNGGANNGVDGAEVVWADAPDLVHSPSIVHDGGEGFLDFTVSAADIQSGNAVVAVKKGGTTVWSWHLWFAPNDALEKIPVTNNQNKVHNLTKEPLGWKPTLWEASTVNKARSVKVRFVQTIKNGGVAKYSDITITQNPGLVRRGATTLYQFGRKDAFPGVKKSALAANSHLTEKDRSNMSIKNNIQNPDKFYVTNDQENTLLLANYNYYNLWAADNTENGGLAHADYYDYYPGNRLHIVKTVYDPCPAGFKMPADNVFTGFTKSGWYADNKSEYNVDGTSDEQAFNNNFGHNFWTNKSKTATIYFPVSGYRDADWGTIQEFGTYCYYWSAVPYDRPKSESRGQGVGQGVNLGYGLNNVNTVNVSERNWGFSVRPVSE